MTTSGGIGVEPTKERREVTIPSPAEIEAAKTKAGGWTRATLAKWGVPWPPPAGWRERLARQQHGRVERAAAQVVDAHGNIGDPWQAETLLAKLERRGDIRAAERDAGEKFHRLFQRAALDPLRAADMARIGGATGPRDAHGSENARRQANAVIAVMGGRASLAGSILWDVIGEDQSMRQWSLRHGRREEVAKGILIATLARLADYRGV
jgi:hypothetical protein